GFLAAGQNIPTADPAKAGPVVWLSANGTSWRRLAGPRLGLPGGTLGITAAAANGGVIVMSGAVAGGTAGSGVWRSTDGGTSWAAVTVPAGTGAPAPFSGVAPLNGGFLAVRPAQVGGNAGANVYASRDGATWRMTAQ